MYDCGLFEAKLLEEWEALTNKKWAPTRAFFTKEYNVVTQATNQEAQRSGYNSDNSLHKLPAAKTSTATPQYDGMSEYAAALEEQVTALQTAADDESSAAG